MNLVYVLFSNQSTCENVSLRSNMKYMQRGADELNRLFQDSCFLFFQFYPLLPNTHSKNLQKRNVCDFCLAWQQCKYHAEEVKEAMRTGSTVSVEDLTYLVTDSRKVTLKHDAKAEFLDTHHDSVMKLTKREIQQSCTQFSKGEPQENEETSRSSQKRKIF